MYDYAEVKATKESNEKSHERENTCVCVCARDFGPGSTIKHARLHQLSAYISPGLQTLTRHFSHNLGDKDISVLNTLNTHAHTHTLV